MTRERLGLGMLTVLCLVMAGWNIRLQSQLSEIRAQPVGLDASGAPTDATAQLAPAPSAEAPQRRARRGGAPDGARRFQREDGADGRAEGGDRPVRGDGGERGERGERPERTEADWAEMRAKMETATVDVVEAYAAQNSWDAETSEEVLAIFLESSQSVGEVWGRMHEGETTHFQARKEMDEIRNAAGADVTAIVGQQAYEELEEHMWEARREQWRH